MSKPVSDFKALPLPQQQETYSYLRVRVIGTLAALFNCLSKTLIEHYAGNNSWRKVKPADFEEAGGPLGCSLRLS